MKRKGLNVCLSVLMMMVVFVFASCEKKNDTSSAMISNTKSITVKIIDKDKNETPIEISTSAKTLGDALYEKELVTEEEYKSGYYTVINGISADYNKDGAWWCITQDGQMTTKGANDLEIKDGDKFEITYTPA